MRRPLNLMKIRPLQYGRIDPLSNTYGKVRKLLGLPYYSKRQRGAMDYPDTLTLAIA
jgi:hypothetical protein